MTQFKNQYGALVREYGPWHVSRREAEHWAEMLRAMGYHTVVESQGPAPSESGQEDARLAQALANMA